MVFSNIQLGDNVQIDPSSSINNIIIGDNVKMSKNISAFGSPQFPLVIGSDTYIGMNSILNGYAASLIIGSNVSIAQNVNIMTDSGPNASEQLQKVFPLIHSEIVIGNHCWIGASAIIMPGVTLGDYCVVAAGSFVNQSYPDYSVIGGTPSRLIRSFSKEECSRLGAR